MDEDQIKIDCGSVLAPLAFNVYSPEYRRGSDALSRVYVARQLPVSSLDIAVAIVSSHLYTRGQKLACCSRHSDAIPR